MQSTFISLLSFIPGPWPIVSCPRDYEFLPGRCKLMIVKGCRHHIAGLRCCLPEESLTTHSSLSFPGQFVQRQIVVALGSDKQELFECHMEASRNGNFQIVSNARMVLVGKVSSLVHSTDNRSPGCVGGGGGGGSWYRYSQNSWVGCAMVKTTTITVKLALLRIKQEDSFL